MSRNKERGIRDPSVPLPSEAERGEMGPDPGSGGN